MEQTEEVENSNVARIPFWQHAKKCEQSGLKIGSEFEQDSDLNQNHLQSERRKF